MGWLRRKVRAALANLSGRSQIGVNGSGRVAIMALEVSLERNGVRVVEAQRTSRSIISTETKVITDPRTGCLYVLAVTTKSSLRRVEESNHGA